MLYIKKIYCRYPVESISTTDFDACGKPVTGAVHFGLFSICLCEEHVKLAMSDPEKMNKLQTVVHSWAKDAIQEHFKRMKELNKSKE